MDPLAKKVLDYWFGRGWDTAPPTDVRESEAKKWFFGGEATDIEIKEQFTEACESLLKGDLDAWQQPDSSANEALAGIIIGDQFFRNVYRGTGAMFASDSKVLPWTKQLVQSGRWLELKPIQQSFVVLPYMHSEKLEDQQECVRLCGEIEKIGESLGEGGAGVVKMAANQKVFAQKHLDLIAHWGRFPHRNALLGRENTPEEAKGLEDGSIARF